MEELTQTQLQEAVRNYTSPFAVFFLYPFFCGTCKMAARMLDIVLAADPSLPVKQSNLYFTPGITAQWQIRSVPCIAIVKEAERPALCMECIPSTNCIRD